MNGTIFKPLRPDQVQLFEDAVKQTDDPIRALTGKILLYTGMRNGEYGHMRPWWLSEQNDDLLIEIPGQEECVKGVGPTGAGNEKQVNLNDRGEPCCQCRNKASREDDCWHAKTEAAKRTIVVDSSQDDLIELLDWWSKGFDFVPLSHRGVNYHLRQLAEEAGLDRDVTANVLRLTHGRMLGWQGCTEEEIMTRLGYSSPQSARKFIADFG